MSPSLFAQLQDVLAIIWVANNTHIPYQKISDLVTKARSYEFPDPEEATSLLDEIEVCLAQASRPKLQLLLEELNELLREGATSF